MHINNAVFVKSSARHTQCPDTQQPEIAFIGRSNVGKSSLINMLLNRKELAKISSKPGKTQLINHYLVNEQWHLVDLPGYGWAKVSKTKKIEWEQMIRQYLLQRKTLAFVMVLVDARLKPQQIDIDFIKWLGESAVPFVIVMTKADKLSGRQVKANMELLKETLKKDWEELPPFFLTSARDKTGQEVLLGYMENVLQSL